MQPALAFASLLFVSATVAASEPGCQDVDAQLTAMVGVDQQVREEWHAMERKGGAGEDEQQALKQRWRDIDDRNLKQLKSILSSCGWPRSAKGSHDAWLLVQHADADIAFQRQARGMLAASVQAGIGAGKDLAYLTDRIATAEGRPQEYGTQFTWPSRCELTALPVDDIALVNRRRLALGLQSLEDYLAEGRRRFMPADCPVKD